MKWYIGQEIVAIEDHPQGKFKKNDEFTITGIDKTPCCKSVILSIGLPSYSSYGLCICGHIYNLPTNNSSSWYHEKRFAPKETIKEEIELSEYTENELLEELTKEKEMV